MELPPSNTTRNECTSRSYAAKPHEYSNKQHLNEKDMLLNQLERKDHRENIHEEVEEEKDDDDDDHDNDVNDDDDNEEPPQCICRRESIESVPRPIEPHLVQSKPSTEWPWLPVFTDTKCIVHINQASSMCHQVESRGSDVISQTINPYNSQCDEKVTDCQIHQHMTPESVPAEKVLSSQPCDSSITPTIDQHHALLSRYTQHVSLFGSHSHIHDAANDTELKEIVSSSVEVKVTHANTNDVPDENKTLTFGQSICANAMGSPLQDEVHNTTSECTHISIISEECTDANVNHDQSGMWLNTGDVVHDQVSNWEGLLSNENVFEILDG